MAWIIALALFWAVGSLIAKGIDHSNNMSFEHSYQQYKKQQAFLVNLYVAAWPFYQQYEQQAIQLWEKRGFTQGPFFSTAFNQIQQELFGESAENHAIREGWYLLNAKGIDVYQVNPIISQKQKYGQEFILARTENIDWACLFSAVHTHWLNGRLSDFYKYWYVEQTDMPVASALQELIPPIIDQRVAYYTACGLRHERYNFPYDYADQCKLYELRHPGAQKKPTNLPSRTTIGSTLRQCPCCLKKHNVQTIRKKETAMYKGEQIEYWGSYLYCKETDSLCEENGEALANDRAKERAYMMGVTHRI